MVELTHRSGYMMKHRQILCTLAVSWLLTCGIAGCKHPFRVNMSGDLTTRMPVNNTASPVRQQVISGNPHVCDKIAIVDIDGMLLNRNFKGMESMGENPVALFHEKLTAAARDPLVRAVVVRINSPGGSVTASDLMRRDLQQFKLTCGKPVVVSILDVGAGGAFYIATAADLITAHPTSIVGGVGVIINTYNLADTLEQQNIEPQPVRAGEFVDLGSPVNRLSESGEEILQSIADQFHTRFQEAVLSNRPSVSKDSLDGRIFTSTDAQKAGLVDEVSYLDDAIAQAAGLAGSAGDVRVVMFRRSNDRALTEYDITPNTPTSLASIPLSIPGLDRASLPHFLYLWQPEPGLEYRGY